jgi:hypothetical protein
MSKHIRHEPDNAPSENACNKECLYDPTIPLHNIYLSCSEKEISESKEDNEDSKSGHAVS